MWKHLDIPRRHRLQFDRLEDRQLLSGGAFAGPRAEFVTLTSGSPIEAGWVSGNQGGPVGSGYTTFMSSAARWGPAIQSLERGGSAPGGFAGPAEPSSFGGFNPGSPGWYHAADPASSPSAESASSFDAGDPVSGGYLLVLFTFSTASGLPGGGWNSANGTGASLAGTPYGVPSGLGGSAGSPPLGVHDPGDAMTFARPDDPGSAAFALSGSNVSPVLPFTQPRDHLDAPGFGTVLAAALNGGPVTNGPGVQALAAPGSGAGGASTVGGPGFGIAPSASALPAQPSTTIALDGAMSDHAIAWAAGGAQRLDGRAGVDQSPVARTLGRSVAATTQLPSLLVLSSGNLDPAAADQYDPPPSPRGADLIAEALPFAGDSLERSLDEFVRQLKTVDVAALVTDGPAPLVVASLAVASAAASAVVVREIVRRRSAHGRGFRMVDPQGRELALSFPELPRSWSEKR